MAARRWTYQYRITKGDQRYKTDTIWGFSPAQARDFFVRHPDIQGEYVGRVSYDRGDIK